MAKQIINWCREEEAMQMLGFSSKVHLRVVTRDPKRKKLPIRTSKINGRTILYSKTDIEAFINSKATA